MDARDILEGRRKLMEGVLVRAIEEFEDLRAQYPDPSRLPPDQLIRHKALYLGLKMSPWPEVKVLVANMEEWMGIPRERGN